MSTVSSSPRDADRFLAFDLGAESGRAMLAELRDGRMHLSEVHRFPNRAQLVNGRLCWDPFALFHEMKSGLARAVATCGGESGGGSPILSAGIDTWGVDFGLIDRNGDLLGPVVHYRDARTDGVFERAFRIVPREEIFRRTGIQFLQFNTLFQLLAMREAGSPALDVADRLLMMPDLLAFWFTGRRAQEFTDATTTQCWDPARGEWAWDLIDAFGIPRRIFGEVTPPGSVLGELSDAVMSETGARGMRLALPASHDTGSAVIATPARDGDDWAYISCGTWALIGMETLAPVVTPEALAHNFTNEGGAFGTNRLLTNCMGMWPLQRARAEWAARGDEISYADLAAAAEAAPAFAAWIDPEDGSFFNPPSMLEALAAFFRRTGQMSGQTPPESPGAIARCILESLAANYRRKIEAVEAVSGRRARVVHMLGGGSRNPLLCRMTADACGRPVLAGPDEATALGNALVQAAAMGRIANLGELREIAWRSAEVVEYHPNADERWNGLAGRLAGGAR